MNETLKREMIYLSIFSILKRVYQNGEISFAIEAEITEGYGDVIEDVTKLDAYVTETDRKLKVYLKE